MKKIIFSLLLLVFILSACTGKNLTLEEAKSRIQDFLTKTAQPGTQISIKEVIEDESFYKVTVNFSGEQEAEYYMTKDGKSFIPQILNMDEYIVKAEQAKQGQEANAQQALANIPKKEKPEVELFVMSHCPYGTQIEKGILPVVKTLGEKVDFKIKFVDYAMHDTKEIDEQINQYCIQKDYSDKYLPYLECFLLDGNTDRCLKEMNINTGALDKCIKSTDKEFGIKAAYADKTTWKGNFPTFGIHQEENTKYAVQGSPTLVINGQTSSIGRDSASLLKGICAGFEGEVPSECETVLPATAPSPGFGAGTQAGGASDAECGS